MTDKPDERALIVAWLRRKSDDLAKTREAHASKGDYLEAAFVEIMIVLIDEILVGIERGDHTERTDDDTGY